MKAALLAGVVAAASLVAAAAQQSDAARNPLAGRADAAAAGKQIFDQTCASCHGAAGQGDRGPALDRADVVHGGDDADLFHAIRTGVPGSGMPAFPRLTDEHTWQLVTYIRSLTPSIGSAAAASTVRGDAPAGEALFFGKAQCSACHEVNGRGGIVGPDLSTAGRMPAATLRKKILDPASPLSPGRGQSPQVVVATTKDGRQIRGVRRNEDTFTVQIVDASGTLHLLDKQTLTAYRVENTSLMPADYASRLSVSELDHLVAYLVTLKERETAATDAARSSSGVTGDRLVRAGTDSANWLMYWGDYQSTHFSRLDQINARNVQHLRAAWTFQMAGESVLEATPLVVDGVMYTTRQGVVCALDAATGRQIWRFMRPQQVKNPYEINPFNRGVAILGQRLFFGTLDAALVALDARTGRPLWEVQVADTMVGYSITSAPLVVKDKVLVGVTGGEFGARGFLDAYDAVSGRRLWRWYAVPAPGEFGNDTWSGDSWQRGGSPMWLTGSYDPDLNLVYWAVGNPGPQFDRSARGDLDNLFSDSVVAIDPETGQRRWHYQFTPNDGHDWDSCEALVLVDRVWHGERRKLLLHADRNGMFYVLDRTNGAFLAATPFVYQNWNAGFDTNGRPKIVSGSNSSRDGSFFVYPTVGGGTNFQAPSYSPITGWLYLEYREGGQGYVSAPVAFEAGRQYLGREAPSPALRPKPGEPDTSAGIKALDPETGQTIWDFKIFQGALTTGVLATSGNVVFGALRDGNLVALDAQSGVHLWHFQTGAMLAASPMTYAVSGRQFVAIAAGDVVYAFALGE
jgi:PQQ-dependent dehydrogenase (methanol/ethanol family)